MSHLVTIKTKVHDIVATAAACHRLGLAAPVRGTVQLFSGSASGLLVQLPGWHYPAVIDVASGEVPFDNYDGKTSSSPRHRCEDIEEHISGRVCDCGATSELFKMPDIIPAMASAFLR